MSAFRRPDRRHRNAVIVAALTAVLVANAAPALAAAPADVAGPHASRRFDLGPVRQSLTRLLGAGRSAQFDLSSHAPAPGRTTAGNDTVTVSGRHGRIAVSGSSPTAILLGVNTYLTSIGANISWNGEQVNLPGRLTPPARPITRTSTVTHRYEGNSTEDGYSGPYRTYADWERLIDVMALHGINEMYLPVGTEAAYYTVLRAYGYSDAAARAWIPNPAHQPWWLLQNMSGFAAPISTATMQARVALGARIAAHMRQLGITPVLPGFFGTVPTDFATKNPGAQVVPQGTWEGFPRPGWLDPTTPLYKKVAARFYAAQKSLLGDSSMFEMDLLHEGGQAGDVDIAAASKSVQQALESAHPGAIWAILGWQSNPRPQTIAGVDRSHMLVVDGLADRATSRDQDALWSHTPWAFGSIWEFGGNASIGANLTTADQRFWAAQATSDTALNGIALMPESSYNNPAAFEFLAQLPWQSGPVDMPLWFAQYADARYGAADPAARAAWSTLLSTAYSMAPDDNQASGNGGLFTTTPSLSVTTASCCAPTDFKYDPATFATTLTDLLGVAPRLQRSSAYRYDLMDVTRQVIDNRSRTLLPQIKAAYDARDRTRFDQLSQRWMSYLQLLDDVTATNVQTLLGTALAQADAAPGARSGVSSPSFDQRSIVTTWGDRSAFVDLHDYANRDWSGLISGYYAPNWRRYFASLDTAMATGAAPATIDWYALGEKWSLRTSRYPTQPHGDIVTVARRALTMLTRDSDQVSLTGSTTGPITDTAATTVSATVTNSDWYASAGRIAWTASAPAGVRLTPTGAAPTAVGPGSSATRSWSVRTTSALPAGTTSVRLTLRASYVQAGSAGGRTVDVTVPILGAGQHYLSDLPFSKDYNQDGLYPVARDTVTPATPEGDGKPIRLGGVTYPKGLGTNANADVRVQLDGACSRFTSVVGIDDVFGDPTIQHGDVIVTINGDRHQLFQTGVLTSGAAPVQMDVDITGVHELSIVVGQADGDNYWDAASFGDAAVSCS